MSIADYRDLTIVIFGVILIIISLALLVLILIVYWKLRPIFKGLSELTKKLIDVSDILSDEVLLPIVQVAHTIKKVGRIFGSATDDNRGQNDGR
jgi:hypothetical protein